MKRIDLLAFAVLNILFFGVAVTARAKSAAADKAAETVNRLKQIALAFHNYNDSFNSLPYNGGSDQADSLKAVNYGWHNPDVQHSGTWATQILPFLEQDALYRNAKFTGVAPPELPKYPADKVWQVSVTNYLCAERNRVGFQTGREQGDFPGPVTDFAINVFLNAPPIEYSTAGFGKLTSERVGDWAAAQNKATIQGIQDGSSNTLMVGGKALPPAPKAEKKCGDDDCAPVPAGATSELKNGDEGIFSPGNWSIEGKTKKRVSTGTARGHVVVKDPPKTAAKENPPEGSVPWMYADSELTGKALPEQWTTAWGGPFEKGVYFAVGDGSVRMVPYGQKGTPNFARMLYPNDGNVVNFD